MTSELVAERRLGGARMDQRALNAYSVLVVLSAFTYLSPVQLPFDTQPYALFASLPIIAMELSRARLLSLPTSLLVLFVVLIVGAISWLTLGATVTGARSLAGYATTALVATAAYFVSDRRLGFAIPVTVLIWLAVGLVQRFIAPGFGGQFLSRLATSDGRGVTSLAVEPSIYAIVCVFLFLMNDYSRLRGDYGKRLHRLTMSGLAVQVWLAGSALGLLLVLIYLSFRALFSASLSRALTRTAVAVLAGWTVLAAYRHLGALRDTRAAHLIAQGISSPGSFIYSDQSVAERFFALQASHQSLLTSRGLGFGLGSWAINLPKVVTEYPQLARYDVSLQGQERVMSGFGTAIFELGAVGLLVPLSLALALLAVARSRVLAKPERSWALCAGATAFVVMEAAIPLAFPLFGFTLGTLVALSRKGTGFDQADLRSLDGSAQCLIRE